MKEHEIILNRIKTPDGTILTSYFTHDYQSYIDKNGETYIVDGGNEYLRRSVNIEPYEELSVYFSDDERDYPKIRESFHRGSRGKRRSPRRKIPFAGCCTGSFRTGQGQAAPVRRFG